jgi:hypothetical protein
VSERKQLDQYFTPDAVADALVGWYMSRYGWPRTVLEPSSGGGAFCRAIRKHLGAGVLLTGIDMDPRCEATEVCDAHFTGDFDGYDFGEGASFDLVTGNPPFSHAEEHVRRALELVSVGGHVAVLLRLAFMEAVKREAFWAEFRAREILVLRQRPSFTGGKTDSCAYGFFVFERGYRGATVIHPCWAPPEQAEAAE